MSLRSFFACSCVISSFIWAIAARAESCPEGPLWQAGRDASCSLLVDGGGSWGTIPFQSERANDKDGGPIGTFGCENCNYVYYDLVVDGYQGRPPGSCLTAFSCPATQNRDLGKIWGDSSTKPLHVLLKHVEIKNAFKAWNTRKSAPHVDTLQGYQGGFRPSQPKWIVIQDSIFRNSDDQVMLFGNMKAAGMVLQNVVMKQDAWFAEDCLERAATYEIADPWCGADNGYQSDIDGVPIWLIDFDSVGTTKFRVNRVRGWGPNPVITIGTMADAWEWRNRQRNGGRHYSYGSIEEALSDVSCPDCPHQRPPFLALSCAGWRDTAKNAPGCTMGLVPETRTSARTGKAD